MSGYLFPANRRSGLEPARTFLREAGGRSNRGGFSSGSSKASASVRKAVDVERVKASAAAKKGAQRSKAGLPALQETRAVPSSGAESSSSGSSQLHLDIRRQSWASSTGSSAHPGMDVGSSSASHEDAISSEDRRTDLSEQITPRGESSTSLLTALADDLQDLRQPREHPLLSLLSQRLQDSQRQILMDILDEEKQQQQKQQQLLLKRQHGWKNVLHLVVMTTFKAACFGGLIFVLVFVLLVLLLPTSVLPELLDVSGIVAPT